jgi:hypothetical protein
LYLPQLQYGTCLERKSIDGKREGEGEEEKRSGINR